MRTASRSSPLERKAAGPLQPKTKRVDLVANFGGVGDGITNNNAAILNFRAWARAQVVPVVLTIPAGAYVVNAVGDNGYLFNGVKNLTISAYGASFLCPNPIRFTGTAGFRQEAGFSARVQTVLAGATTASLIDVSKAALFPAGAWCSLNARDMQGPGGFPPNPHYNQFVKVTGNDGGAVSFWPPAKEDYSRNYQETKDIGADYDTGGPASLHLMTAWNTPALADSWDVALEVRGLRIVNLAGAAGIQVYNPCRMLRLIDMAFVDCSPIPTTNQTFYALRCRVPNTEIEIDKVCETIEWDDCDLRSLVVQSSSAGVMTFTNTRVAGQCVGTTRRVVVRDGSVVSSLTIGTGGYGHTESVEIKDTSQILALSRPVTYNGKPTSDFANSNGRLTYNGGGVLTWGVAGALVFVSSTDGAGHQIFSGPSSLVASAFGDPTILETTLPDPLPVLQTDPYFRDTRITQHPCPSISVDATVTGCAEIEALARAPKGIPYRSYNYAKGDFANPSIVFPIWGRIVHVRVNVVKPYPGTFHLGTLYNNAPIFNSAGALAQWGPTINAAIPGERIITPTQITGAQTGDNLGIPSLFVFQSHTSPWLNADLAGVAKEGRPVIEYEILTNQMWN